MASKSLLKNERHDLKSCRNAVKETLTGPSQWHRKKKNQINKQPKNNQANIWGDVDGNQKGKQKTKQRYKQRIGHFGGRETGQINILDMAIHPFRKHEIYEERWVLQLHSMGISSNNFKRVTWHSAKTMIAGREKTRKIDYHSCRSLHLPLLMPFWWRKCSHALPYLL